MPKENKDGVSLGRGAAGFKESLQCNRSTSVGRWELRKRLTKITAMPGNRHRGREVLNINGSCGSLINHGFR